MAVHVSWERQPCTVASVIKVTQLGITAKLPFCRLCTLRKWSKLSVPQFPHLCPKDINVPRPWNRWWVLNEIMYTEQSLQGVALGKHSKTSATTVYPWSVGKGSLCFHTIIVLLWNLKGRGQWIWGAKKNLIFMKLGQRFMSEKREVWYIEQLDQLGLQNPLWVSKNH